MPKLFFLFSGEHKTLPFAELKSILEAEGKSYEELQTLPQVMQLDSSVDAVGAVKERAALTRICCKQLFCCGASRGEIIKTAQSVSFDSVLEQDESFAVRVHRVGEAARNLAVMDLERKLGELVLNMVKGSKVNLRRPQKTLFGTITDDVFFLGLKLAEISPTPFMERQPRKRPFFHPSAMPAKLARCMVNLARPRSGDMLVDPFCGTGTFLVEAGLLGCRVLGFDAKKHMLKGCLQNLRFFSVKPEGVAVADAKHLPFAKVDCIVTDPPYGRSSSTLGYTTEQIVQDFLTEATDALARGQRICIAAPKTVPISGMTEMLNLEHVQSHLVYVHRSLTRKIAVLEKA